MGDVSRKIDVEKLIACSDDLVSVLKNNRDADNLTHCLQHSQALRSSCDSQLDEVRIQLQDYEGRIDECKQKMANAKSEVVAGSEIELLQKELESELEKELRFKEELRVIINEINDLERERISGNKKSETLKKLEQDELRAQRKLSMYASVANVIPNLDDHTKVSGHIVHRDKKVVEKFEFDPTRMTTFDTCQSIWSMINP